MRTYLIEDSSAVVHGYYKTLTEAKYSLKVMIERDGLPASDIRIMFLKGQYFGEGFHNYVMYLKNGKFIKPKNWQFESAKLR